MIPRGLAGDPPHPERAVAINPFEEEQADGDILVPLLPEKWMPLSGPRIAHYIAAGKLTAEKASNRLDLPGIDDGMSPRCALNAESVKPDKITNLDGPGAAADDDDKEWDQARVLREAERCLSCGTCNMCRQCVSFCPDASINPGTTGDFVEIDLAHCKGCGICAYECPRGVITMEESQQ